jgi:hypothetical protein
MGAEFKKTCSPPPLQKEETTKPACRFFIFKTGKIKLWKK